MRKSAYKGKRLFLVTVWRFQVPGHDRLAWWELWQSKAAGLVTRERNSRTGKDWGPTVTFEEIETTPQTWGQP